MHTLLSAFILFFPANAQSCDAAYKSFAESVTASDTTRYSEQIASIRRLESCGNLARDRKSWILRVKSYVLKRSGRLEETRQLESHPWWGTLSARPQDKARVLHDIGWSYHEDGRPFVALYYYYQALFYAEDPWPIYKDIRVALWEVTGLGAMLGLLAAGCVVVYIHWKSGTNLFGLDDSNSFEIESDEVNVWVDGELVRSEEALIRHAKRERTARFKGEGKDARGTLRHAAGTRVLFFADD